MLQEREFEHTFQGYTDALEFLKKYGKFTLYHQTLSMDEVVAEANRINTTLQILTEDA